MTGNPECVVAQDLLSFKNSLSALLLDEIILSGRKGESTDFLLFSICRQLNGDSASLWVHEGNGFKMVVAVSDIKEDTSPVGFLDANTHPFYFQAVKNRKAFFYDQQTDTVFQNDSPQKDGGKSLNIPVFIGRQGEGVFRIDYNDFSAWQPWHMIYANSCAAITSFAYERNLREQADMLVDAGQFDKHLSLELFLSSSDPMAITSENGNIIEMNPAFERLIGGDAERTVGKKFELLLDQKEKCSSLNHSSKVNILTANGSKEVRLVKTLFPATDINTQAKYLKRLIVENNRKKDADAHIFDELTGLPGEKLLQDRIRNSIIRNSRSQFHFAICVIDIDGFRNINKKYGRQEGDRLLSCFSKTAEGLIRIGDTLAKIGSNEFAILVNDIADATYCLNTLDRIKSALNANMPYADEIGYSVGITLYPEDDGDAETLLRHARQAMFIAKREGGAKRVMFDPETEKKLREESKMRDRIREGMSNGEFHLFFQPKLDMKTGLVVGGEVLSRWIHPHLGMLPPMDFIPFIENSDELSVEFGEFVVLSAMKKMSAWASEGFYPNISINISPKHLQHASFPEFAKNSIKSFPDIPNGNIEFEIVETGNLKDTEQVARIITECQDAGISFSVDDFGTGYSSLSYLRDLPATTLKLDKSFVFDMLDDDKDLTISRAIAKLSEAFDKKLVAEGVETKSHAIALSLLGYNVAQGYAIAKPLPENEFRNFANNCSWNPISIKGELSKKNLALLRLLRDVEKTKPGFPFPENFIQYQTLLEQNGFPRKEGQMVERNDGDALFATLLNIIGNKKV